MSNIDPITLELIKGAIRSARSEMEALIERTSMSPFIREKKDYFTAMFDAAGRMVYGNKLPLDSNLLEGVFDNYPAADMQPGDMFWYNDPYESHGAVQHLPDTVFISPVFSEGELMGFAQAWGHLWDIGGIMPGSISPDATETFHEGIMIPPTRIYHQGKLNEELFRVYTRNSRFPEIMRGDLKAIMASCRLGKQRMEEMVGRFGNQTTRDGFDTLIHQTEAAVRQALETKVPDGTYAFRDWLDSDAVTDNPYSVHVELRKKGSNVEIDFTKTDDQAQGSVNFIMHDSVPKNMYGMYLTSDDPTVLFNSGFEQAFGEVKTRKGSLVDPVFPAALGMRSHTMIRVNAAVFGTLAQATGGQTSAASPVYVLYYMRSLNRLKGDYTMCIEGLAVGMGARSFADGIDSVYYVAQKNYPIEFAEMEFGVRIEGYRVNTDSGGPGRYRGGAGIIRDVRVIADQAILGCRLENVKYPAWGVNGGHGARPGRFIVNPGTPGEYELKPLSDQNKLKKGDLVRVMTTGGGGWGNPLERPTEQVLLDVLDGFVSAQSAHDDYGVVLKDDGAAVDEAATATLRKSLAGPTKLFHRGSYYDDEARA